MLKERERERCMVNAAVTMNRNANPIWRLPPVNGPISVRGATAAFNVQSENMILDFSLISIN